MGTSPYGASTSLPLCSIIIPSYNVERYVATAIESALSQTHVPFEVVVVNDGSTDSTADAIRPFLDRVVYVEQENRGLAGARNRGIRESKGSIIGLLDADDIWLPERLARCVGILEADPGIGFLTTDAFLLEEDTPTERHFYGDFLREEFPPPGEQLEVLAMHNFMFVSAVIRRDLLDRHGLFDEGLRRSEDYDLWMRFALAGERAALVPEPLAWYRIRSDSLSADAPAQWDAHLSVLEKHLPELSRRGIPARPGDVYDIARRLARRGDHRGAARFYRLAARHPGLRSPARLKAAARAALEGLRPAAR